MDINYFPQDPFPTTMYPYLVFGDPSTGSHIGAMATMAATAAVFHSQADLPAAPKLSTVEPGRGVEAQYDQPVPRSGINGVNVNNFVVQQVIPSPGKGFLPDAGTGSRYHAQTPMSDWTVIAHSRSLDEIPGVPYLMTLGNAIG